MLNTMKTAERSRLDAAHELGHLVLHRNLPETTREHEDEAQVFGTAFLLPRAGVLGSGSRGASLSQVLAEKRVWNVSATSYTRRLNQLELLNDWQYRNTMIELTKRGYRSGEPDGAQRERSQLMSLVLGELRSEGVGTEQIARDIRMSVPDLTSLVLGLATVAV